MRCWQRSLARAKARRIPADLMVGLDHMARDVSYCHYALEILAHELSWK